MRSSQNQNPRALVILPLWWKTAPIPQQWEGDLNNGSSHGFNHPEKDDYQVNTHSVRSEHCNRRIRSHPTHLSCPSPTSFPKLRILLLVEKSTPGMAIPVSVRNDFSEFLTIVEVTKRSAVYVVSFEVNFGSRAGVLDKVVGFWGKNWTGTEIKTKYNLSS